MDWTEEVFFVLYEHDWRLRRVWRGGRGLKVDMGREMEYLFIIYHALSMFLYPMVVVSVSTGCKHLPCLGRRKHSDGVCAYI